MQQLSPYWRSQPFRHATTRQEAKPTPADTATPNSSQTEENVASDNEEPAEIDYFGDLSTDRYDGYNFRILVRNGKTRTQYFEEDSDDNIESAIYRRNKEVEDKYGITISISESSSNNSDTDALNSILAGDDAYDMIFAHSRAAFIYAVNGAGYNVLDIPTIHLDKPWWSRDIVENCMINDRLYVLDGDISIDGLSLAMCMLFNKRIFDENGLDYPYQMVRDGDWTFDEFAYLAKKGGADLNGDGVMKPEDDQFGFITGVWDAPIGILYTGGQRIYQKNDDGTAFELTLYSNKTVSIFDEFFSLMNNEACFLHMTEGDINYTGEDIFAAGRAMIKATTLGVARSYRNMDDDFGVLPFPKFDEDDEYATVINGYAPLIIIPITVPDVERTGAIIEALAAHGSKYVLPAFYDVSLKGKHARDDESK